MTTSRKKGALFGVYVDPPQAQAQPQPTLSSTTTATTRKKAMSKPVKTTTTTTTPGFKVFSDGLSTTTATAKNIVASSSQAENAVGEAGDGKQIPQQRRRVGLSEKSLNNDDRRGQEGGRQSRLAAETSTSKRQHGDEASSFFPLKEGHKTGSKVDTGSDKPVVVVDDVGGGAKGHGGVPDSGRGVGHKLVATVVDKENLLDPQPRRHASNLQLHGSGSGSGRREVPRSSTRRADVDVDRRPPQAQARAGNTIADGLGEHHKQRRLGVSSSKLTLTGSVVVGHGESASRNGHDAWTRGPRPVVHDDHVFSESSSKPTLRKIKKETNETAAPAGGSTIDRSNVVASASFCSSRNEFGTGSATASRHAATTVSRSERSTGGDQSRADSQRGEWMYDDDKEVDDAFATAAVAGRPSGVVLRKPTKNRAPVSSSKEGKRSSFGETFGAERRRGLGKENVPPAGERLASTAISQTSNFGFGLDEPAGVSITSTRMPLTPRLDGGERGGGRFEPFYVGEEEEVERLRRDVGDGDGDDVGFGAGVGLGLGLELEQRRPFRFGGGEGFAAADDCRSELRYGNGDDDLEHAMDLDERDIGDDKPITPLKPRPRAPPSRAAAAEHHTGAVVGHRRQQSSVASLGPWQTAESMARPSRMRMDWSVPAFSGGMGSGVGLGISGVNMGDAMELADEFDAFGLESARAVAGSGGAGPLSVSVSRTLSKGEKSDADRRCVFPTDLRLDRDRTQHFLGTSSAIASKAALVRSASIDTDLCGQVTVC